MHHACQQRCTVICSQILEKAVRPSAKHQQRTDAALALYITSPNPCDSPYPPGSRMQPRHRRPGEGAPRIEAQVLLRRQVPGPLLCIPGHLKAAHAKMIEIITIRFEIVDVLIAACQLQCCMKSCWPFGAGCIHSWANGVFFDLAMSQNMYGYQVQDVA